MSSHTGQASASDLWEKAVGPSVDIPFISLLGFEISRFEEGLCEITYVPKQEHLNSFEVTHGGALMTLLDAAMASAARSYEQSMGVVTIEMKTTFMQPATGVLTARATLIHRTATMAFTEGSVFNKSGRICAHGTGTFKYVKRLPTGSKQVNQLQHKDV